MQREIRGRMPGRQPASSEGIVKLVFGVFLVLGILFLAVSIGMGVFGPSFSMVRALVLSFGVMGMSFAVMGGIGVGWAARVKQRKKRIRETGQRLYAKITDFYLDRTLEVNGRNPWRLRCVYLDPVQNVRYEFRSDCFWERPTEEIIGQTVPVYVESGNYRHYVVETDGYLDGYLDRTPTVYL